MKSYILLPFIFISGFISNAQEAKVLTISDILALKRVREVQVSPDEKLVAFTITSIDTAKDKSNTQIWMVFTSGGEPIQMTSNEYSARQPRWSPDGKYLSFIAAKGEKAKKQVWNLNRLGGEAQQVTKTMQGVSGYQWSPDSKRLLLILKDPKPTDLTADTKDDEKPLPYVIDRLHFKQDHAGYLDRRRNHLYVFTPGDSAAIQITSGDYDDSNPKWSPDGKSIAYVTSINEKIMPFASRHLAVISADGGIPKVLTKEIDRNVIKPTFSKDGKTIMFIMEDSGERQLASITVSDSELSESDT